MFYKRVVVYLPDEGMYKALKHKTVDDGLTLNALMLKLIREYLNGDSKKPISTKTLARQGGAPEVTETGKATEVEFWEKEANKFDTAMPRHSRPRKGPLIEPVEVSVRAYEKGASKP